MTTNEKLLDIRGLTVEYHTVDGVVRALTDLSLSLAPGRTLGLVGETGAGKTTASKAVMGILPSPPARVIGGQILFEGIDLLKKTNKEMRAVRGKQISMIFQDPMTSLNPVIPVLNQIAEVIELHSKADKRQAREKAAEMLELVGIRRERGEEYPHQFSGGMKQRVVIAIALACNPRLLIADEPTTALDVTIQAQVLDLMRRLKAQYGTSMIMITHDLGIVAETCDEVAVIYAGRIVEYGALRDIFTDARHPYTKGLFACIPNLYAEDNELTPIKGLMPDPANLPPGCSFSPRCPEACAACREQIPPEVEAAPGHLVRCIRVTKGGAAHGAS